MAACSGRPPGEPVRADNSSGRAQISALPTRSKGLVRQAAAGKRFAMSRAMTAIDICKKPAVTADPNESLVVAAKRMRSEHVGDLVVTDDGQHPIGMLTDRDIVVSAIAQSADQILDLRVGDVMTLDPMTAHWDEPVETSLTRMSRRGIRRLPVIGPDGALAGILTLDDIVRALSFELSGLIGAIARERDHERLVRT